METKTRMDRPRRRPDKPEPGSSEIESPQIYDGTSEIWDIDVTPAVLLGIVHAFVDDQGKETHYWLMLDGSMLNEDTPAAITKRRFKYLDRYEAHDAKSGFLSYARGRFPTGSELVYNQLRWVEGGATTGTG